MRPGDVASSESTPTFPLGEEGLRQFIRLVWASSVGYAKPMRSALAITPIIVALFLCGCDAPVDRFPANDLHALVVSTSREVPTEIAADDTTAAVEAWFGNPNEPRWPVDAISSPQAKKLVDLDNLKRAAGPVYSDQDNRHFGLFQRALCDLPWCFRWR